jgi:hypothetical protein
MRQHSPISVSSCDERLNYLCQNFCYVKSSTRRLTIYINGNEESFISKIRAEK